MKIIRVCFILLSFTAVDGMAQESGVDSEVPAPEVPAEAAVDANPPPEAAAEESVGPVIPAPYAVSRYETAWSKNPFLRKTVVISGPKENFGKDWALSGMAGYDGKIRVTIINKQTGERKHVSNKDAPDAEFKLIKANFSRMRSDASAEIEKGGEVATITYDENLTAKPITINNTQRQANAGQPGQPGQPGAVNAGAVRPGQPGQPGQPVRPGQPVAPMNRGPGGAVVTPPGMAPVNAGQPVANTPMPINANPAAAQPTISRRRQLVPAPVIPPQ